MRYDPVMAQTDPTRRRRVVRGCAVALLLGLLTNLAVAWGLGLLPHALAPADSRTVQLVWYEESGQRVTFFIHTHRWFGVQENQYHTTRRSQDRDLPTPRSIWWAWSPLTPPSDSRVDARVLMDEFAPANPGSVVVSEIRTGFPALTFRGRTLIDDSTTLPNGALRTRSRGVFIDRIDGFGRAGNGLVWPHAAHVWLPYQPIWSGLAINTVLYALLVALLGYIHIRIRNARRMLRGRCPYCAYEMQHDFTHGCPECGWRRSNNAPEATP